MLSFVLYCFMHLPLSSQRTFLESELCLAHLHSFGVFSLLPPMQWELESDFASEGRICLNLCVMSPSADSFCPQLCTSDKLWEQIVQSACDHITPDMRALAEDMGWRQMFFTNKLQLQRHLRKRKQRHGSQRSSQP